MALSELFYSKKLSSGITKTTLCKKIVHEFLQPRLGSRLFDRLLWLPLRRLKKASAVYTWKELLQDVYSPPPPVRRWDWDKLTTMMSKAFASTDYRSKTLFLLDCLDEVSHEWNVEDGVYQFLQSLICDAPNVILTSRPQASSLKIGKFDIDLETIGFTLDQIGVYMKNCIKDRQTLSRMRDFITTKPVLQGLLRIQVLLDAFCCTWVPEEDSIKDKTNLSDEENLLKDATGHSISTMTTLYIAISNELCKKDLARIRRYNQPQTLTSFDVQDLLAEELRLLEEFAF